MESMMKDRFKTTSRVFFMVNFMLFLLYTPAFADTLNVATGGWLPYIALVENDPPGYAIEIVKTILERAGHSLIIENIPYMRALKMVHEGELDMIICTRLNDHDLEKVVIADEEIGMHVYAFYVTPGNPWQYEGVQSLSKMKLGLVIGETYPGLESYIENPAMEKTDMVQFIGGEDAYERNLKKLVDGRIDVIVDNENVIKYYASRSGVTTKIQRAGYLTEPEKLVVAFTKKLSHAEEYAAVLSKGIKQMRESGELQQILSRYGLTDWK